MRRRVWACALLVSKQAATSIHEDGSKLSRRGGSALGSQRRRHIWISDKTTRDESPHISYGLNTSILTYGDQDKDKGKGWDKCACNDDDKVVDLLKETDGK